MKRKHHSFILLEIVVGLFLFSLVATYLIEGIFRSTKKTYQEIEKLGNSEKADEISFSYLQETILKTPWKDLIPYSEATWTKENPSIKWGYLTRYDIELANATHYRVIKLSIQFNSKEKPFSYCYIMKKK